MIENKLKNRFFLYSQELCLCATSSFSQFTSTKAVKNEIKFPLIEKFNNSQQLQEFGKRKVIY